MTAKISITTGFVHEWAKEYDKQNENKPDGINERAIRAYLARLPEPKYLDREHFLKLAEWKSPRPRERYELNNATVIEEVTKRAYRENDDMEKLRILDDELKGVGTKVAATILHFMFPDRFPVFDYHCCEVLIQAGKWKRSAKADSPKAWAEYVGIMQTLAKELKVTLRELDKALITYHQSESKTKRRP